MIANLKRWLINWLAPPEPLRFQPLAASAPSAADTATSAEDTRLARERIRSLQRAGYEPYLRDSPPADPG